MRPETGQPVGANAARVRTHNRQMLLHHVRNSGPIGRAEIARATGLSTQAVSNIIADLLDDDLLIEHGTAHRGRGLPVMRYALNPKGGFALGIEVRPDALFAALLDFCGQPVFSRRMTLQGSSPDHVRGPLEALLVAAMSSKEEAHARSLGAGIVLPGPFGQTGIAGNASELSGWAGIDPNEWFEDALGQSVKVEKDANAAAMAERVSGVAREINTFAYLYFGAGLGLGMVQDGRLVIGANGNAGEIGHISVPFRGEVDNLENLVSRLSVQKTLANAGQETETSEDLERLFENGDPTLLTWLKNASNALSVAVGLIENLFDPETVILGGAMPATILDELVARTVPPEQSVANRADRTYPRLLRGTTGRMTATHGAAALVLDHAFTPKIAIAEKRATE